MVIVEAKCRCGYRMRRWIHGKEVEYPIYRNYTNISGENPLLKELSRIPQAPLYRKRIRHCNAYAEDVRNT
jgi:hypothetical protein